MEQACDVLGWRLPRSRFTTREAPHRFLSGTQEEAPRTTTICMYVGFQTEIHFKPRASPQAELRPGRLPTSRITTREPTHKQNCDQGAGWLAGWLAGGITYDQGACHALGWLASWGAGWLVGCGQERPRQAQKGGAWIEQACPGVQSMLYVSLLVFLYRDTYICTYTHTYKERPRESM